VFFAFFVVNFFFFVAAVWFYFNRVWATLVAGSRTLSSFSSD
jgi:hypothetical protein